MKKQGRTLLAMTMTVAMATATISSMLPANGITAQAASVRLSKTSLSMKVGQSKQLKVKGTKKTVKWSVSNGKILKVTKQGKVTAKKAGSAKVYAKVSKKRLTCKVKVSKRVTPTATNTVNIPQTITAPPQITTAPGITNYTGQNAINGVHFYMDPFDEEHRNEQYVKVNIENFTSYEVYLEPDAYITTDGLNYKARICGSKNETYENHCVLKAFTHNGQLVSVTSFVEYDSYDYVMSDDPSTLDYSKYWLPTNGNSTMTFYVRMNGNRYRVSINYSQQGAVYTTIGEEAVLFTEIDNSTPAPKESVEPDMWTESTVQPSQTPDSFLESTISPAETEQPNRPQSSNNQETTTTVPRSTQPPRIEEPDVTEPAGTEKPEESRKPDRLETEEPMQSFEPEELPVSTVEPTEPPQATGDLQEPEDSILIARNGKKDVYIDGVKISLIQSDNKLIIKAENTLDESVALNGTIQFVDAYGEVQDNYGLNVFDIAPDRTAYYQAECYYDFAHILLSQLQIEKREGNECVSDIFIEPMSGYGEQVTITEKYLGNPEDIDYGYLIVEASIVFYDEDGNILEVEQLMQSIDGSNNYESVNSYECIGAERYEVVLSGAYY